MQPEQAREQDSHTQIGQDAQKHGEAHHVCALIGEVFSSLVSRGLKQL